jgi:hypothetical protein
MTDTTTPALIEVTEGTTEFHRNLAVSIAEEFGGFLKIHSVIDGTKYKVSQVKFRQGGLASFLAATKDQNSPAGATIRSTIGSQDPDPTTAVAILGGILSARINVWNQGRGRKFHYGLRLRSNNQLGIYLTLGVQDLESFFQRGRELNYTESVAGLIDANEIAEAL